MVPVRGWLRGWLCVLAGLAWVGTACAATPAPTQQLQPLQIPHNTAPTFTVYSGRDGLGDQVWNTIGFDARGFVWAGSASSLAWFDGYRWHKWPQPQPPSLVRDMAVAQDGTLWTVFEDEGLARFNGHTWVHVGKQHFYYHFNTVTSPDGPQLWVVGPDSLMHLHDGTWVEAKGKQAAITTIRPQAFAETHNLFGGTRQWLGSTRNGLWYRQIKPNAPPGPWQHFDNPLTADMRITDMLASINDAGQEELWVLSYGGGLARVRNDGVRVWTANAGQLPSAALYDIAQSHNAAGQRRLWVASRGGLIRIRDDGKHIDVFDMRDGLPSNAVRGVKVQHLRDGADVLWLATEGGIARAVLNNSSWRTVSLLGATFNGTFGLMIEPDGHGSQRLWIGSAKDGLAMLDQGKWRRFDKANGALPSNSVAGIWRLPGADGKPARLLSLEGGGLFKITDDLSIVPMHTPWPIQPDASATDAVARSYHGQEEWWISTHYDGIYRWRDGQWRAYTIPGTTPPVSVWNLVEQIDSYGKSWLWAATSEGLARFDGKRWRLLDNLPGASDRKYMTVTLLDKHRRQQIWAGTYHHGIVRLDVSDPRHPRALGNKGIPPLPDQTIYSILPDSKGRIYICTNNGVQQLTPRPQGGYQSRVFRRSDGLVNDECNVGTQHVDTLDRYWVGTLGGLSMYDPRVEPVAKAHHPKPLFFTSLSINGKAHVFPNDASFDLPPGNNRVQIGYALLVGQRESETRYRSQLLGDESTPTAWTARHQRTFTNLPPGDYQLQVEARDFSGSMSTPRTLDFTVEPFWWQRMLWQILIAVLAAICVLAGILAYNRGIRARQRKLRFMVAERTQALRIANERLTELSYLDPLTGIANRRRLMAAMDAAIERAREQQLPLGLILVDIDHFKHYNDRHGHVAGDAALRAVAQAMKRATRERDLVARFGGEEFVCLMTDSDLAEVTHVAERIRTLVASLPPRELGNDSQTITVSAGVLSMVPAPEDATDSMLEAVDSAMYKAKASGRDRVVQKTPQGFVLADDAALDPEF